MAGTTGRGPMPRTAGFTLIELAVALSVIGILIAVGFKSLTAWLDSENRKITEQRLDAIQDALTLYVTRNKRLPCPADASLAETNANAGLEQPSTGSTTTCTAGAQYRGVPWRALGLPQEVSLDGWRRRISYHVYDDAANAGVSSLTRIGGMDMSACRASVSDTAGAHLHDCASDGTTAPNVFLRTKGLTINILQFNSATSMTTSTAVLDPVLAEDATAAAGGGAAYVLVSHGVSGLGAYLRTGAPVTTLNGTAIATYVLKNQNADIDTIFNLGPRHEALLTDAANYFDDYVRAPTIHAVASEANLGPQ